MNRVFCMMLLAGCTATPPPPVGIEESRFFPSDQIVVHPLSDGGFWAHAETRMSDGGWLGLSDVDPNPPRPPPSPAELAARFPPTYSAELCDPGYNESHVFLDGLQLPDKTVDYLELRYGDESQGRAGWRCSRAPNFGRCEASYRAVKAPPLAPLPGAVEAVPWGAGLPAVNRPMYLVVERAGAFSVVASARQIAALLGPIDTLSEAALLVKLRGYVFHCRQRRHSNRSTGEAEGTGWRLTAMSREPGQTPGDSSLARFHVLQIGRDGSFDVKATAPASAW